MQNNRSREPPDGGYGWVVLVCCAICLSNLVGLARILGLVFVEIIEIYDVTRTQVFLVQVFNRIFGFIFAPFIGKLFSQLDCNVILCTGCLLVSLSLILTACTTAYWQIVITYGCLQGIGQNCVMAASPLTVGLYFKKHRSIAMGMLYTIAGISGIVFPMLFNWLLEIYHFNGALLIMGGIALHSCAAGMLVRQPTWLPRQQGDETVQEELQELTEKQTGNNKEPSSARIENAVSNDAAHNDQTPKDEEAPLHKPKSMASQPQPSKLKLMLEGVKQDLKLFQDGYFLLLLFNRSCSIVVFTYFWTILPDFVEGEFEPQIHKTQIAFILSTSSIGAIAVRLVTGPIVDVLPWPKRYSFAAINVLLGLTALFFQFFQTYTHIFIGSIFFASWMAMFVVLLCLVEIEAIGPQRVHMANGLIRFTIGFVSVIGGILIGYLRDTLGSYVMCLSLLGGFSILGGLVWILEPLVVKCFPPQVLQKSTQPTR